MKWNEDRKQHRTCSRDDLICGFCLDRLGDVLLSALLLCSEL